MTSDDKQFFIEVFCTDCGRIGAPDAQVIGFPSSTYQCGGDDIEDTKFYSRPPFFTDPPLNEAEIIRLLEIAADNIELSLARVHFHKTSGEILLAVERLGADAKQLLTIFPNIHEKPV